MYKGRPKLYGPNAKNPQRRAVYRNIVDELEKGTAISKIAKDYGVTRQTTYRIQKDYAAMNKVRSFFNYFCLQLICKNEK